MTEAKETEVRKTVGEMTPDEFFGTMLMLLDKRRAKGDPALMEMTVKEFTESMIEVFKTRAFGAGIAETNIAERIMTDWQGLQNVGAVSQPFRIKTPDDLKKFTSGILEQFGNGIPELVVAVAIVQHGAYSRVP